MRTASLRRTSTHVGGGERPGQPQPGGRGGRHRRGQRTPRGWWCGPARQHPAQGGVHGGERGVGVPHRDGDDERGTRVHRPHGGGAQARAVGVCGVQELEQVVQRELARGECAEQPEQARGAVGDGDQHAAQQRQQHHEQREVGQRAAARRVTGGRQQGAEQRECAPTYDTAHRRTVVGRLRW